MLDRSFSKKNKAGKRVCGGGNSYSFRVNKENVTEKVLSKELKDEDWARYTEECLRQMNDK